MLVGYHDESSDEKLQELEEEWKKTGSVVAWCGRFEPPQNEGFSYQQMVVMPKNGGTPQMDGLSWKIPIWGTPIWGNLQMGLSENRIYPQFRWVDPYFTSENTA